MELLNLADSLELDKEDYVILSSGALLIRGLWPNANDLDIAITEKGLDKLKNKYNIKDKEITSGNGFFTVTDNVECILDDMVNKKELYEGYYIEDIYSYYDFLVRTNREKDKLKRPKVEEYIRGIENGK